ncbi:MAG: hypothetical protein GF388_06525 [Candidatus Aegiribacteria sp.]|nr:hypothetical protein [Candidatus Aegiribacteria sp.]MBD3294806.1 hypothetical protein [Candidatus Fermentibacteria bacterium]
MWNTFDEYYIGFIFSNVDWDAVYDEYLPLVENVESQQELIDIFTEILAMFEDGHLWIYLPSGEKTFPWMPDYTPNYDMPLLWSLIEELSEDGFHSWDSDSTWGHAMIDSIPYIMIRQMASDLEMGPLSTFVLNHQDAQAMIIDVRMNGGGVSPTLESIARYFCSEETLICQTVVRNGPGREDLTQPEPVYIYPLTLRYEGPVILLIGEYSASATEWFAAAVDQLPHFALAGDTTMKEINSPSLLGLASGYLNEMIVVDSDDRTIYKVSASSNSIKDQCALNYSPVSVSRFTQTDDLIAVACADYYGTVFIMNSQTFFFSTVLETGKPCQDIVCFSSDTTVCTTHPSTGSAGGGLTITSHEGDMEHLEISGSPVALCAHPAESCCYVLSNVDGKAMVMVVDVADREIDHTFEVGGFPVDITTHRNGEYLLVLTVG